MAHLAFGAYAKDRICERGDFALFDDGFDGGMTAAWRSPESVSCLVTCIIDGRVGVAWAMALSAAALALDGAG